MKSQFVRIGLITFTSASMLLAVACGSDVSEPEEGGDETSNINGGEGGDDSGSGGSTTSGNTAECGPASVKQDDACEVCIATQCTAEALACCQQTGCLAVVRCAAESGCNGIDCYSPDKCQAEIDAAGLEVATTYAQALGDCAIESCAVECEQQVGSGGAGGGS